MLCVALPAALAAQGRARPTPPEVPENMRPPVGKCRIWMDGVAAAQQPAPTDCQTALRQKPSNGTVIFGPSERRATARGFSLRPRPSRQDSAAGPQIPTARRQTVPPAQPGDRAERRTPERSTERTPDRTPERTPPRATPTRPTPVPVRPSTRPSIPDTSRPAPRRPDTPAAGAGRP
jgi:hypothetical protein